MKDVTQTRIASALTAALGVWLLLSPIFIETTGGALVSTLIAGSILTLAGIVEFFWENIVPSWASGLTAAWMAISTAIFGMTDLLFWNTILIAAAIFAVAIWDATEVGKVVAQRHHTRA
jgi:hypothetical protein